MVGNIKIILSLIKADFICSPDGRRPASRSTAKGTTTAFCTLFPPSPPLLFPHWLGTQGLRLLIRVLSGVSSHPVVSKMPQCSSCVDTVILGCRGRGGDARPY